MKHPVASTKGLDHSAIKTAVDDIVRNEILNGVLIEDIQLSAGVDYKIRHGLGRKLKGWIVSRLRHDASAYTPIKTKIVAGFDGSPEANTTVWDQGGGAVITTTATNVWRFSVTLDVGQRLRAVRARILDNVTGTTTLQMIVERFDDGTGTTLGSPTSAGNGTEQTLAVTGLTETFDTNSFTRRWVVSFVQSAANACRIRQMYIDYDELETNLGHTIREQPTQDSELLILRCDTAGPKISLWVY